MSTGSCFRFTGGTGSPASVIRATTCGTTLLPPLAMTAVMTATCSAVASIGPCPMAMFALCPSNQPSSPSSLTR